MNVKNYIFLKNESLKIKKDIDEIIDKDENRAKYLIKILEDITNIMEKIINNMY